MSAHSYSLYGCYVTYVVESAGVSTFSQSRLYTDWPGRKIQIQGAGFLRQISTFCTMLNRRTPIKKQKARRIRQTKFAPRFSVFSLQCNLTSTKTKKVFSAKDREYREFSHHQRCNLRFRGGRILILKDPDPKPFKFWDPDPIRIRQYATTLCIFQRIFWKTSTKIWK